VAYTADLITVLHSLFLKVTRSSPSQTPKITSQVLNEVCQAHKLSDTRRQIYRRINGQTPGCDESIICRLLRELLGCDPVSPPNPESTLSPSSGVAIQSPSTGMSAPPPPPTGVHAPSHPTEIVTPSPPTAATGVAVSSPHSNGVPAAQAPPRSTSPPVWHCLFPCLVPSSQRP
jgi:hypothetical protein